MVCGQPVHIHLRSDSNSAIGVASRKGLQRFRHLDVRFLWLQAEIAANRVATNKVLGQTFARVLSYVYGSYTDPRNSVVIQSRDSFEFVSCLCVTLTHTRRDRHELHIMSLEVITVCCVATAMKCWSTMDVADSDSVKVRLLWHGEGARSRAVGTNIIRF